MDCDLGCRSDSDDDPRPPGAEKSQSRLLHARTMLTEPTKKAVTQLEFVVKAEGVCTCTLARVYSEEG